LGGVAAARPRLQSPSSPRPAPPSAARTRDHWRTCTPTSWPRPSSARSWTRSPRSTRRPSTTWCWGARSRPASRASTWPGRSPSSSAQGQDHRPGDQVRRRRPGHGHADRAPEL